MIRKIATLILFTALAFKGYTQQDPMYSLYVFNGLLINPAYAGTREVLNATVLYRNQWVNIPGAPVTGGVSLDSPIKNEKISLGLNVFFDKIGVTDHTTVSGIYSYKLKFQKSVLTLGLEAGAGFFNSTNSEVRHSDDTTVDPAFVTDYHMVLPNFSCGAYYYRDRYYAGLSVTDILGKAIQNRLYPNTANDVSVNVVSHFFLNTGYLLDLSPAMKFQPSVLLKYVPGAPLEADVNGVFSLVDVLYLGIGYRSNASVNFLTQVRLNQQLCLGYCYEYSTNELSSITSGSHEVVLRYQFDFSKGKILTPRFF
jgi:type IX secretion system PorP/SprF family membrane protein